MTCGVQGAFGQISTERTVRLLRIHNGDVLREIGSEVSDVIWFGKQDGRNATDQKGTQRNSFQCRRKSVVQLCQ